MNHSLSVILPIHNAQDRLATQIERLLDVLPDLTDQFEIIVVDDGSTDWSDDVATELAMIYPQVRVIHHARQMGAEAVIDSALNRSRGDVVLVHDRDKPIDESTLIQMWAGKQSLNHLTGDNEPRPLRDGLLKSLSAWGGAVRQSPRPQAVRSRIPVRRRRAPMPETVAQSHRSSISTAVTPEGES